MALPSLLKRGRRKRGIEVHQIGPRMDDFDQWLVQKDLVRMADETHTEFGSYLLENLEKMMQLRGENQLPSSVTFGEFVYKYSLQLKSVYRWRKKTCPSLISFY